MIIKALDSSQEKFGQDIDDFLKQVFIGPEEIDVDYEVNDFNLININCLVRELSDI
jgi:hypothetical protein